MISWVTRVHENVVGCWFVSRLGKHHTELQSDDAVVPRYECFVSLKDLYIVPTDITSPARLAVEVLDLPLTVMGLTLRVHEAEPLLGWQASHGFANVPEKTLEKLVDDLDLRGSLPENPKGVSRTDHLALNLSRALIKDLSFDDANALMIYRCETEEDLVATECFDDALDNDIFLDIATRDDQQVAKEHKVKQRVAREQLNKRAYSVRRQVEETFKHYPKAKVAAIAKEVHAAKLHTKVGLGRRWATVVGDKTFLEKWKPPSSGVFTDVENGRWRVTIGAQVKSFSWTKRGEKAATKLCLQFLWEEHLKMHPLEQVPEALEELFKSD